MLCKLVVDLWNDDTPSEKISEKVGLSQPSVSQIIRFSRIEFRDAAKQRYLTKNGSKRGPSLPLMVTAYMRHYGGTYAEAAWLLEKNGIVRSSGSLRTMLVGKTEPYQVWWSGGMGGFQYMKPDVVLIGDLASYFSAEYPDLWADIYEFVRLGKAKKALVGGGDNG